MTYSLHLRSLGASTLLLLSASIYAQQPLVVTVEAGKQLNPLTRDVVGVYTQVGDANLLSPATIGMLRIGGFTAITYPTGWESASDQYHWATNTFTPNAGNADAIRKPYSAPGSDIGHLLLALDKTGIEPVIHVNYGANAKGTGGGEPKEAAAWVAYANGSPDNKQEIGADSTGFDWKSVGFWAGLRAATPLSTDDGYNLLRINHPEPAHIQIWQIGEDVAENGYYGGDHKGTLDLHAPYPPSVKSNDKRRKLKELSPGFYGERVVEFVKAMKAVDPKIAVGASLTAPPVGDGALWAPDWNGEVLRTSCSVVDFVSFDWHPGATLPPDWKTLDDKSVLNAPQNGFTQFISEMLYEDKRFCPTGKVPRVVLSAMSPIPWATPASPIVKALFAADAYATMAEAGIANASWFQLRDKGITNDDGKPTPAYFGTQMFHIMAARPGDGLLATSGSTPGLTVHAAHRQEGLYGVMLINKDGVAKAQVRVTLHGGNLAGGGVRFVYGDEQMKADGGPSRFDLKTDGDSVMVDVPPYSIVDLLLPMKK
jgi:hypothetical protein